MFSMLIITTLWAVLPDLAALLSQVLINQTSAVFIHLPFSRLMESEADAVGLNLAAKVNILTFQNYLRLFTSNCFN